MKHALVKSSSMAAVPVGVGLQRMAAVNVCGKLIGSRIARGMAATIKDRREA